MDGASASLMGTAGLNESPSQKEGKLDRLRVDQQLTNASMKALPKRKGNYWKQTISGCYACLNESPSQKEGKSNYAAWLSSLSGGLNESPSQKEGKFHSGTLGRITLNASMKALPKRKGNLLAAPQCAQTLSLNESPSQKEGK